MVEYSRQYSNLAKALMLNRAMIFLILLTCANNIALAAAECPAAITLPKPPENVVDWYDKFVAPWKIVAGAADATRPTRSVVEAYVERTADFHRRSIGEPLFFESLVRQIAASYVNEGDFMGLNSLSAQKIYRASTASDLDFSIMCIDTRRSRFPEDTFGITLFGVNLDNCQHAAVRGIVFSTTLINGAPNGACRADYDFYRMIVVPVRAGTNTITFVCRKDAGGCAVQ
jgi:hypothetical protein